MTQFEFYRRDLPHYRLAGSCYFVTFRLLKTQAPLGSEERTLVQQTLLHGVPESYALDAHVVMNDHVHALVRPKPALPLERVLHRWKSFTARALWKQPQRQGAIWQREYFDRIVRNEQEWMEKMEYIAGNPLKRWPELQSYPWVFPAFGH